MSPVPSSLLATLPEFPAVGESLLYQLNGLIVVLAALTSIWGALEVIGFCFKRAARRAAAAGATPASAPSSPVVTVAQPAALTLVLIAAAVHAALGRRARVRAVCLAEPPAHWAQEGRRQIFASHKVR